MNKIVVIVVLVTVGVISVATFLFASPSEKSKDIDPSKLVSFAKCLADKKVTMYGASWCSHCKKQKELFGSSFKYVHYVECTDNPKVCVDNKIDGYPTWVFPDGSRLQGERGFEELSKKSSCSLSKS